MSESILTCAHCDSEYTHHVAVDIHSRQREDAKTVSTRAYGGNKPSTGNPSSRRDGLVILNWCEHCHGLTELRIYQHKGVTFIEKVKGETESTQIN